MLEPAPFYSTYVYHDHVYLSVVVPAEHVEHLVAADGKEGGPHPLDIGGINAAEADQQLSLADHLVGPLFLVKVSPKRVGDRVRGDLVAVCVQVLHLHKERRVINDQRQKRSFQVHN